MPLYEYVCRACHREFEELVMDKRDPACPRCKAEDVQRVLSCHSVGKSDEAGAQAALPPGCGRCGDPRGPGACGMS